jgi:hypothetical protein
VSANHVPYTLLHYYNRVKRSLNTSSSRFQYSLGFCLDYGARIAGEFGCRRKLKSESAGILRACRRYEPESANESDRHPCRPRPRKCHDIILYYMLKFASFFKCLYDGYDTLFPRLALTVQIVYGRGRCPNHPTTEPTRRLLDTHRPSGVESEFFHNPALFK